MNGASNEGESYVYGGLSGVQLSVDHFELAEGIELRQTYAHLFSAGIMAFAPPGPKGYHPAPWKAARGGFSYDIEMEIRVPNRPVLVSLENTNTVNCR